MLSGVLGVLQRVGAWVREACSPESRKAAGKGLRETSKAVTYTLLDMSRFPCAFSWLTTRLDAPDLGSVLALTQGLCFVLFASMVYVVSNVMSNAFGGRRTALQIAEIRRAADLICIGLGLISMGLFLGYAYLPLNALDVRQRALMREFIGMYVLSVIPSLWVIVREENLIAANQSKALILLNALKLANTAAISYGLVERIGGWGLGLGLGLFPSLIALVLLEMYLGRKPPHQNGLWKYTYIPLNEALKAVLKELAWKGCHAGLVFFGGYIGFLSTLWVQGFKHHPPHDVANNAAVQIFFLLTIPGIQVTQVLASRLLGKPYGKMRKRKTDNQTAFDLTAEKNSLTWKYVQLMVLSLLWPACLIPMIHFVQDPYLDYLSAGLSMEEDRVTAGSSFSSALPFVYAGAIASTWANSNLTAIRSTVSNASQSDSYPQLVCGLLTFLIVALRVKLGHPSDLGQVWLPLFLVNYLPPLIFSMWLAYRHFTGMSADNFQQSVAAITTQLPVTPASEGPILSGATPPGVCRPVPIKGKRDRLVAADALAADVVDTRRLVPEGAGTKRETNEAKAPAETENVGLDLLL